MNIRILNRAGKLPEDGFYQIEATGEHINHRARVVQVIDAKAVDAIVNRFAADAAKAGEDFPGQRIDKDHLSNSEENPTEALGWAMQLRNRGGIPEAKIDWTAIGRPLIEAKEGQPPVYKFFSTEYDPTECEKIGTRIVNRKSYDVVRPLRLDGLSLTNDPNNKGQRPISNRNGNPAGADDENQPTQMKALLKKMGLDENASEDVAIAHLDKITNRATTAEASVVTLTKERDELLDAQIEADLEKHKNVIKNRDSFKAKLKADRKGTLALLEDLNPTGGSQERQTITNRSTAKQPSETVTQTDAEAAADEQRAAKISNRARQLRATDKTLALGKSYELAEAEIDSAKA